MPDTPVIIATRKFPDSIEARMRELFGAETNSADTPFTHEALKQAAARADILAVTISDEIDAAVIAAGKGRLKMIANFGAGTDHIDRKAAQEAGIVITNTPGVLTGDTADMTMAMILAATRRLSEGERRLRRGEFAGWSPTWLMGRSIRGKNLGIIGLGRIGEAVARRARVFDMKIHYHNRNRVSPAIERDLDATYWSDLDAMLAGMDVVSVNCPSTPETHHLLDAARLAKLPAHAVLVNTARGDVIDEGALADALSEERLAGVALDVFEHEPKVNPKLLEQENALLIPHMGSATIESRTAMGEKLIVNIRSFLDGHRPPDRVVYRD